MKSNRSTTIHAYLARRRVLLAAVLTLGCVGALPATAAAVSIKGFSVARIAVSGAATQPAIAPAPGKNPEREWFSVTNGQTAQVLSITRAGKLSKVTSKISAGAGTLPGNQGAEPSYGAVRMGGYDWFVKYGEASSPLYAVGTAGKVHEVSQNVGPQITDLTVGRDGTLNFASHTSGVITCKIRGVASAACDAFPLANLLGFIAGFGQLDAIAADSGKLWFTDDDGELGSFNLVKELKGGLNVILRDLFAGPFGNSGSGSSAAGEASADAHTIAADKNGFLYVAGGEFTSNTSQNDTILKVSPKNGDTVKRYKLGLTDVTALTSGPSNNIWFLDRKSSLVAKVGELNVHTGKITEHALPSGFNLEPYISLISDGPQGSGRLYFALQTSAGKAAIGQVTGA